MKNELDEYINKKDEEFIPKLMEAMLIVDDLMLWMLARERHLLAGKLQTASLVLDSVYGYISNGK